MPAGRSRWWPTAPPGSSTAPDAGELARAAGRLREHPDEAQAYGQAGRALAARVTWDSCIERLLA